MRLRAIGIAFALAVATNSVAQEQPRPDIVATNAFYYYADVNAAWEFYRDTLGFETVVDYGFAKIMRLAEASYLTLVQAESGMHSVDEPKTVTLSLITDDLNQWRERLFASAVPMLPEARGGAGFVAVDPEGYYLEFVQPGSFPSSADVVGKPGIRATVFSAYFDGLSDIRPFYEGLFDVSTAGELNGVPVYRLSESGFLALVEGSDGLHEPTEKSGVTFSFLTSDIDAWFDRATSWPGFELRTPEVLNEGGLVRVFVGYDPDGIFLEWDTFLNVPENERLLPYL